MTATANWPRTELRGFFMKSSMAKTIVAGVIAGVVVWAITSSLSKPRERKPGMMA